MHRWSLAVATLLSALAFAAPAFAGSISTPIVDLTTPSDGAGARTQYLATFVTSASGALAAGATVDATFPAGTTFTGYGGGGVFNGTTRIGNCPTPNATRLTTCTIYGALAANTTARLEFNGVTNPSTPSTTLKLTVDTSADTTPVDSQPYTVEAAHTIANITVANASPSDGAGASTQYVATFATTATGGLSSTGVSTIDVTFPAGTSFGDYGGGSVFDGATRIGNCPTPNATSRLTTCTIYGAIAANKTARLEFNGVTNTTTPSTTLKLTVATSSDTAPVDSQPFTVEAGGRIANVNAAIAAPSNAASARTQYLVTFTTSASGALSSTGVSTIDATFPSGTAFTSYAGGGVFDGTARIGNCPTPNASTLRTTCTIYGAIAANANVRLEFNGVTNSSSPSSSPRMTVATSSDITPTASQQFTVGAAGQIPSVTVTPGSLAQAATTQYVATFTTSSTGALASTAASTIDVTFPAGTTFTGYTGGGVFDGTSRVGNCPTPNATTRVTTCTIYGAIAAGTLTRLELNGVTNPATPSSNLKLIVATSSDTIATNSDPYSIAVDTVPPETTLLSGPPDTTGETQPTFTFASSEAGSTFECSVDGAAFLACASPFVTSPLAPGTHTFAVRAKDPAANTDATPASRTFSVATPVLATPTPTPAPVPAPSATPTPAPTPVPTAKTVVVTPAGGTVLICSAPGVNCRPLKAGEAIPFGSTVDTKNGSVTLTSIPKAGAAPQTATFNGGIFKVTQASGITDLALTEPLAACAKKGHAASAAKKPKTRKLWGDGKGAFRTTGKYSAATVRGTRWLVQDSCAGTLTKVVQGLVSVRDKVKNKTILVKAGKSYTAKAR